MSRTLTSVVQCLLAVALVGNLGVLAHYVHRRMAEARQAESAGDKAESRSWVEKRVIKINDKQAESYGLETGPARRFRWRERLAVYGRVVPNPAATYEVRSPFAGTLEASAAPWPHVGQSVRPGRLLGRVRVRVGPQEVLDLRAKLSAARLKLKGAEEVLRLRRSVVDRLNGTRSDVVARRDLDEARVQLAEAQTQLATAKSSVALWQGALDALDGRDGPKGPWAFPLAVPAAPGTSFEVTELLARPGMTVEAGAVVARLADFSKPLVRLDLPAERVRSGAPPRELELTAWGDIPAALRGGLYREEESEGPATLKGVREGPAPRVDPLSQRAGYYYRVELPPPGGQAGRPSAWRPGLFVRALLPGDSPAQEAVAVPAEAVLYHQGRALVYVRVAPGKYERREVQVLGHAGGRAVLALPLWSPAPVHPGDVVVTGNPQVLLSTEFLREADED